MQKLLISVPSLTEDGSTFLRLLTAFKLKYFILKNSLLNTRLSFGILMYGF